MASPSTPTHPSSTTTQRKSLTVVTLVLIGAIAGAALMVLLQFLSISDGDALDPASPECANAFDAFRLGERTPSLLQIVNDCTAEAR